MGKVKDLFAMAKKVRACKPEIVALGKASDDATLYELYWDNVLFCVANNFPAPDWIKRNMHDAAQHGLLIGGSVDSLPDKAVLLKGAKASVVKDEFQHGRYWLRQKSSIAIDASDNSLVVVDLYDDSKAKITARGNALVKVFVYGTNKVAVTGDTHRVQVIEKSLIVGK